MAPVEGPEGLGTVCGYYQPPALERRLIIYPVVFMSVCLSVRIISCKQDILKTNLWIFAKSTADTAYIYWAKHPGAESILAF